MATPTRPSFASALSPRSPPQWGSPRHESQFPSSPLQRSAARARPAKVWRDGSPPQAPGCEQLKVSGSDVVAVAAGGDAGVWRGVLGTQEAGAALFRASEGCYVGLATATVCCHTVPCLAAVPLPRRPPPGTACRAASPRPLQWGVAVCTDGTVQLLDCRTPHATCPRFTPADKVGVSVNGDRSFSVSRNGSSVFRSEPGLVPACALHPYACLEVGGEVGGAKACVTLLQSPGPDPTQGVR